MKESINTHKQLTIKSHLIPEESTPCLNIHTQTHSMNKKVLRKNFERFGIRQ